jgi:hypothetical protein
MLKIISKLFIIFPIGLLISFSILILRFKIKYNCYPMENPIDPKLINMPINEGIINFTFIFSILSLPFFVYFLIISIKINDKVDKIFAIFYSFIIALFIYWLLIAKITNWYFD